MTLNLAQLCTLLQVELPAFGFTTAPLQVSGVNTLELAGETDICFAETAEQTGAVQASHAGAVIVPEDFPVLRDPILIRSPEPRKAFFCVAELFVPASQIQGIHPSAVIDPTAVLGQDVSVGPCAVIAADVRIGDRCEIGPGCYLGPDVVLGTECVIEANATLHRDSELGHRCIVHSGTVIGGDGFGFTWDGTRHRKIPQLGRVVIEDEVEIGCNCCVDRATLGETRIRSGAKIDNLVQVAHNTDIGQHVILVSQAGVAGSSTVGTGAVIAGQVAISDHVNVGPAARIGGQSGVTKDVPAGATLFGTPARPMKDTLRQFAALAKLPTLLKTINQQTKELTTLRKRLEAIEKDRSG
jgi:UDP-3-O-[3-hydroxymyristoyl] glucosamine N-acyltransferase